MRLDRKVAIVTGGASGFGEGIVRKFVAEGARVLIADINVDGAERVARELGDKARAVGCDVTKSADVGRMVEQCLQDFGALDILVNNAGFTHKNQKFDGVDEETFDKIYAVNVKSIYLGVMAAYPVMKKAGGGVIINTASTAGLRPRPGLTWYNGSKGAAVTLTKSLAVEMAPDKIRVNALCPVIGETGLLEDFMGMADTPKNREKFLAGIPLGRFSRPEDIASAALYLASDEAEFITGVALEVDGGRCV